MDKSEDYRFLNEFILILIFYEMSQYDLLTEKWLGWPFAASNSNYLNEKLNL